MPVQSLPGKVQQQRVVDNSQVQQNFDAVVSPVDAILDFLNGAFTLANRVLTLPYSIVAPLITGTSVVSSAGFKAVIGHHWLWNINSTSGDFNFASTAGAQGPDVQRWVATHAGSITGISAWGVTGTAFSITIRVVKNGVSTAAVAAPIALTSGGGGGFTTFAKGAITFVHGDILNLSWTTGSAPGTNYRVQADYTIEMTA